MPPRIGIGLGIGCKKMINQDMMIGIEQSGAMITAEMRVTGMIIIDTMNIGVMTDIMDIVGKMTDNMIINVIVGTIMNESIHPSGY